MEPAGALERWYPDVAGALPRLRFTSLPTPIRRLDDVEGIRSMWVKCDDRTSIAYGGNKPRKLEFILADVVRRRRAGVVTFGGLGTHHGLATTMCATKVGLGAHVVMLPQPVTPAVQRMVLLHHALGASLHFAATPAAAAAVAGRLMVRGIVQRRPLALVPPGGSNALGVLAFVDAALELAEQVMNDELPEPGTIFVPIGSGGTVAGLTLGCRLAGLHTRVVGVLVNDRMPPSPARLARMAGAALSILRRHSARIPQVPLRSADFPRLTDQLGPGYGATTPAADAARKVAGARDVALETTYSAKAFAALLAVGGRAPYRDTPILFWNTFSRADPGAGLERWPDPAELPAGLRRFFPA